MFEVKRLPEDFVVEEIAHHDVKGQGPYAFYRLTKRDLTDDEAITRLAEALHKPAKWFNLAGLKDKRAVTSQFVSLYNGPHSDLELPQLSLSFLGSREERLSLGELEGNRFSLVVRKLDHGPVALSKMPNYFGEQRFGVAGKNHLIGKLLVTKDFSGAARMLGYEGNDPLRHLSARTNLLGIMVHSYQSLLFNRLLDAEIRKGLHDLVEFPTGELAFPKEVVDECALPVPGFGIEDERIPPLLAQEGISERDFVIRQLHGLSAEGYFRPAFVPLGDLAVSSAEPDDLNPGFQKRTVSFSLPKGSYATIAVRALFR
ncbi:MAG: tRNA pseudouridine(13) synthase TruD [Nanoarchaeota archaeon]